MNLSRIVCAALTAALSIGAMANDEAAIRKALETRFAGAKVGRITPIRSVPGFYDVILGGSRVQTDSSGLKWLLGGRIMDMGLASLSGGGGLPQAAHANAAANALARVGTPAPPPPAGSGGMNMATLKTIDVSTLPKQSSFSVTKGNGQRQLAVFTDPDCPFCKSLETTLASVNDITIHYYLFPLPMHQDAKRKATAIWCSGNRAEAWANFIASGKVPDSPACDNPVEGNIAFAEKNGISGTPTLIALASGKTLPGAVPKATLEAFLDNK